MEPMWQKRIEDLEKDQATMKKDFANAFPGGDAAGHRAYHEMVKEDLAERKRMRKAITEKSVAGLIWAIIVWIGAAIWHEVKARLGIQ